MLFTATAYPTGLPGSCSLEASRPSGPISAQILRTYVHTYTRTYRMVYISCPALSQPCHKSCHNPVLHVHTVWRMAHTHIRAYILSVSIHIRSSVGGPGRSCRPPLRVRFPVRPVIRSRRVKPIGPSEPLRVKPTEPYRPCAMFPVRRSTLLNLNLIMARNRASVRLKSDLSMEVIRCRVCTEHSTAGANSIAGANSRTKICALSPPTRTALGKKRGQDELVPHLLPDLCSAKDHEEAEEKSSTPIQSGRPQCPAPLKSRGWDWSGSPVSQRSA